MMLQRRWHKFYSCLSTNQSTQSEENMIFNEKRRKNISGNLQYKLLVVFLWFSLAPLLYFIKMDNSIGLKKISQEILHYVLLALFLWISLALNSCVKYKRTIQNAKNELQISLERFYNITYLHFFCDSRSHYWRQNWFGSFYDPRSLWRCSVASVVQSCASAALFGRVSTETPLALTTCGFQPLNSLFNGRFFPQLITTPIIIHFKFVNFFGIYNPHKIL